MGLSDSLGSLESGSGFDLRDFEGVEDLLVSSPGAGANAGAGAGAAAAAAATVASNIPPVPFTAEALAPKPKSKSSTPKTSPKPRKRVRVGGSPQTTVAPSVSGCTSLPGGDLSAYFQLNTTQHPTPWPVPGNARSVQLTPTDAGMELITGDKTYDPSKGVAPLRAVVLPTTADATKHEALANAVNALRVLSLHHIPGVPVYYGCLQTPKTTYVIFDDLAVGAHTTAKQVSSLPANIVFDNVVFQALELCIQIHNRGVVHGNITPDTTLLRNRQTMFVNWGSACVTAHNASGCPMPAKPSGFTHPFLVAEQTHDQTRLAVDDAQRFDYWGVAMLGIHALMVAVAPKRSWGATDMSSVKAASSVEDARKEANTVADRIVNAAMYAATSKGAADLRKHNTFRAFVAILPVLTSPDVELHKVEETAQTFLKALREGTPMPTVQHIVETWRTRS